MRELIVEVIATAGSNLSPSHSARSASASKRDGDVVSTKKQLWPKTLPDQVRELRIALAAQTAPVTAEQLVRTDRVADLLETLAALGQARRMDDGRYSNT